MSLLKSYRTLKAYRKDPLGFISNIYKEQGHRAHLKIFGKELFIISHPKDVLHVLKHNHGAYTKGRTTKAMRQILGSGLITNEGESWKKQYRLIRPFMNLKSVFDIAPRIFKISSEFVPAIDTSKEVNCLREMNRLTWRIILISLFTQEITSGMDDWLDEILELMQIITSKTRSSIPIPFWIPIKSHRRMRKIIKKFDNHVYGLINERRKGKKENDLLQLLIDAQEAEIAPMTDREIRDEIMTFMMAGHETITNSMTWTMIEIAKNTEYREKLESEAALFFENKNFEELNNMPWVSSVIDEVLRLWPPVWVFMRQAETADQIGDMKIPPKANVVLAPINSHRASDLWDKPEVFYPERFFQDKKKDIELGAFYPFGLGPRACIGSAFAGIEAKIILLTMIHHFEWDIIKKESQSCDPGISLRATNNIMMNFRRRS
jgi:cytochrome P450